MNLPSDNREAATPPDAPAAHTNDGARPSKRPHPPAMKPGHYLVATPIGNLGDLSVRARDILAAAALIACEDTRVTGRLLAANGLSTKMTSYHDHSSSGTRDRLIQTLNDGKIVALVSDAGTPLISDPGYRLVSAAVEAGIYVTAAPGPSAPLTALVLSGLPTDRFLFAGFLPSKGGPRRTALREVAAVPATLIFLESPRRIAASLAAMKDVLGDRPAAVARELTKMYEEVRRGGLCELAERYAAENSPKGEIVVVVGPPGDDAPGYVNVDELLSEALSTMSIRDAAAWVAVATGLSRREIYSRALELSRPDSSGDGD